jgi:hypothetical protein
MHGEQVGAGHQGGFNYDPGRAVVQIDFNYFFAGRKNGGQRYNADPKDWIHGNSWHVYFFKNVKKGIWNLGFMI